VAWTITSDKRLKENITESNLGLAFITQLQPVSYTRTNDESKKTEYGFIAQELESKLKEFNADTNGIITIDDEGYYSVRYNDLLAPMVKAIQEQNELIEKQQQLIEQLSQRLEVLENKN
jgi:trimeric autotransporter adhesin